MTVDTPAQTSELKRVLVVGAGLLGTSIGLAAARAGITVTFEDVDDRRAQVAADMVRGWSRPHHPLPGPPDLIVIAVPPAAVGPVLSDYLRLYVDASIMDIASIKSHPLHEVERLDGVHGRVVLTHPIGGSASSGPAEAHPDLLRGRAWAVCPVTAVGKDDGSAASAQQLAQARVLSLVRACGAVPLLLDAERHDQLMAFTSHLPQLAASALAASLTDGPPGIGSVAGPAALDMTRIADSPSELWAEIAVGNRHYVASALAAFDEHLGPVRTALASGTDGELAGAVRALVLLGQRGKAALAGKHRGLAGTGADRTTSAGADRDWTWVEVVVDDRRGSLVRLFETAAAAGVNVEDVRIDHAPHAPSGTVSLAVAAGAADGLRAALAAQPDVES